jgi:hypothetical protein
VRDKEKSFKILPQFVIVVILIFMSLMTKPDKLERQTLWIIGQFYNVATRSVMFEAKATFFATIDGQNVTFVPLSTQQVRQSIFLLVMAMIWPILSAVSAH